MSGKRLGPLRRAWFRGRLWLPARLASPPSPLRPTGRPVVGEIRRVVVLHHASLPTLYYFFQASARRTQGLELRYVDIAESRPRADRALFEPPENTLVVLCRYGTGPWLGRLEEIAPRLAGIVYFTDDDLDGLLSDPQVPLRYRMRIRSLYGRHAERIGKLCSEVWASNERLAARFPPDRVKILPPVPGGAPGEERDSRFRYFYHGTGVHRREVRWLAPVVDEVQQRLPHALFEVSGTKATARYYRTIPRVMPIHPASWSAYYQHTMAAGFDVGLAPLLPAPANLSRTHIKFFDITRAGAAGIYSNVPPYADFVRHEVDGLLLPNQAPAWTAAIERLAADPALRKRLVDNASRRCAELASVTPTLSAMAPVGA